jgi:hypothetical protein
MWPRRLPPVIRTMACCLMVVMPSAALQSPGLARLAINSKPPGASITVNGKAMNQPTDATFVVGPGKYTVAVSGGQGNLNCAPKEFAIAAGQVKTVTCSSSGWSE